MNKQEAVDYFGSIRKAAEALKLSVQAVRAWPDVIPELRAYQIKELIEKGKK